MSRHLKNRRLLDAAFCRQILRQDGQLTFVVNGVSMSPVLCFGQKITVRTIDALLPGRCYVFQLKEDFLVHRLLRNDENTAAFIGDNCFVPEMIPLDNIVGSIDDGYSSWFHAAAKLVNSMYLYALRMNVVDRRMLFTVRRKLFNSALFVDRLMKNRFSVL